MFQVQQQLFNYRTPPNTGDTITVTDISDNGTNNITIDRNSEKIEGAKQIYF